MKPLTILLPALIGLTALPATAQPVDVDHGRALAETWCVNCHVIDREQTTPVPAGPPSFPALADDPDVTDERLASFMRMPHPPMPNMSLTNIEVQDLVGYIGSLKQ
ncbi:c-type cytochrome [Microbaculum marinisediminis]|uniref:Cytochrome c n=1 Tax=Microbaculum marinisediminis TaxID=2931392 RepID=A0AAW5QVP8_9HYPH|nr:c-type cytochrome [Microbaculum sp. A6E488]MCT8970994.1 cytochrome c [Microbaculum sp. A6E488]